MARPLVALLTDFGTRDHYAGTLKGVLLSICPDVTLVDISHDIPPHDVVVGALELQACYKYFPQGTIFLVVVDPGVGTSRRGIAAETTDYRFVGPDNGVLSLVFEESAPRRTVELTERRYARPTISRTFEGRDRFAPAAAWLAKGIELTALGRPSGPLQPLGLPRPRITSDGITGQIVRVDRFGNLITNIDRKTFEQSTLKGRLTIRLGDRDISKVVSTYGDAAPGEVCALFGSSDHLEIATNGGNASQSLSLDRGAPVHVVQHA